MSLFQETLADPAMLPADLRAWLQHARPNMPAALLVVLAQLWEPEAVAFAAAAFGSGTAPAKTKRALLPRGQAPQDLLLRAALVSATQNLSDLLQQDSPGADTARAHRRILHEQGVGRVLGTQAVMQRIGLLSKDAEGPLTFPGGQPTQRYRLCQGMPAPLAELAAKLEQPWPQPASLGEYASFLERADADLRGLGSWAGMGGEYVRPHVLRKLALLMLEGDAAPRMDWKKVPRMTWLAASPDAKAQVAAIPQSWTMARIMAIAPRIKPSMCSMWVCLLGSAMANDPTAQEEVQRGDSQAQRAFAHVAQELRQELGVTPSPRQVMQRMRQQPPDDVPRKCRKQLGLAAPGSSGGSADSRATAAASLHASSGSSADSRATAAFLAESATVGPSAL